MLRRVMTLFLVVPAFMFGETADFDEDDNELVYDDEMFYDIDNDVAGGDEEEYAYMCDPYNADCEEMWFWEDEAVYPTKRDNTWVDELTKPW